MHRNATAVYMDVFHILHVVRWIAPKNGTPMSRNAGPTQFPSIDLYFVSIYADDTRLGIRSIEWMGALNFTSDS
jgi:hypothetical protein